MNSLSCDELGLLMTRFFADGAADGPHSVPGVRFAAMISATCRAWRKAYKTAPSDFDGALTPSRDAPREGGLRLQGVWGSNGGYASDVAPDAIHIVRDRATGELAVFAVRDRRRACLALGNLFSRCEDACEGKTRAYARLSVGDAVRTLCCRHHNRDGDVRDFVLYGALRTLKGGGFVPARKGNDAYSVSLKTVDGANVFSVEFAAKREGRQSRLCNTLELSTGNEFVVSELRTEDPCAVPELLVRFGHLTPHRVLAYGDLVFTRERALEVCAGPRSRSRKRSIDAMQELVAHVAALAPCTALAMPNGRTAYAREAKERGVERQDEVIAYEARLNRRGQRHRNEQDPEEAARDAAQGVRSNEFTDSEDDASSGAASDASDDEDYVAASTSRALVCTAPPPPRAAVEVEDALIPSEDEAEDALIPSEDEACSSPFKWALSVEESFARLFEGSSEKEKPVKAIETALKKKKKKRARPAAFARRVKLSSQEKADRLFGCRSEDEDEEPLPSRARKKPISEIARILGPILVDEDDES